MFVSYFQVERSNLWAMRAGKLFSKGQVRVFYSRKNVM